MLLVNAVSSGRLYGVRLFGFSSRPPTGRVLCIVRSSKAIDFVAVQILRIHQLEGKLDSSLPGELNQFPYRFWRGDAGSRLELGNS